MIVHLHISPFVNQHLLKFEYRSRYINLMSPTCVREVHVSPLHDQRNKKGIAYISLYIIALG